MYIHSLKTELLLTHRSKGVGLNIFCTDMATWSRHTNDKMGISWSCPLTPSPIIPPWRSPDKLSSNSPMGTGRGQTLRTERPESSAAATDCIKKFLSTLWSIKSITQIQFQPHSKYIASTLQKETDSCYFGNYRCFSLTTTRNPQAHCVNNIHIDGKLSLWQRPCNGITNVWRNTELVLCFSDRRKHTAQPQRRKLPVITTIYLWSQKRYFWSSSVTCYLLT
jgi:hypothetical protein